MEKEKRREERKEKYYFLEIFNFKNIGSFDKVNKNNIVNFIEATIDDFHKWKNIIKVPIKDKYFFEALILNNKKDINLDYILNITDEEIFKNNEIIDTLINFIPNKIGKYWDKIKKYLDHKNMANIIISKNNIIDKYNHVYEYLCNKFNDVLIGNKNIDRIQMKIKIFEYINERDRRIIKEIEEENIKEYIKEKIEFFEKRIIDEEYLNFIGKIENIKEKYI